MLGSHHKYLTRSYLIENINFKIRFPFLMPFLSLWLKLFLFIHIDISYIHWKGLGFPQSRSIVIKKFQFSSFPLLDLPFSLFLYPLGENVTCVIFKCDIYWLFTHLHYTFTIILVFYHKFPHNACFCDPLRLFRLLLSFLPEVVYFSCARTPLTNYPRLSSWSCYLGPVLVWLDPCQVV